MQWICAKVALSTKELLLGNIVIETETTKIHTNCSLVSLQSMVDVTEVVCDSMILPVAKCSQSLAIHYWASSQIIVECVKMNVTALLCSAIARINFWQTVSDTNGQRVVLKEIMLALAVCILSGENFINVTFKHMDVCICILLDVHVF